MEFNYDVAKNNFMNNLNFFNYLNFITNIEKEIIDKYRINNNKINEKYFSLFDDSFSEINNNYDYFNSSKSIAPLSPASSVRNDSINGLPNLCWQPGQKVVPLPFVLMNLSVLPHIGHFSPALP